MNKFLLVLSVTCSCLFLGCAKKRSESAPPPPAPAPAPQASPVAVLPPCVNGQGCLNLSWDPITQKTDGTPVSPNGYKIYYGTQSGKYSNNIDVGNTTSYTIRNLAPGVYYIAATAYVNVGTSQQESGFSNEVNKGFSNSQSEFKAYQELSYEIH